VTSQGDRRSRASSPSSPVLWPRQWVTGQPTARRYCYVESPRCMARPQSRTRRNRARFGSQPPRRPESPQRPWVGATGHPYAEGVAYTPHRVPGAGTTGYRYAEGVAYTPPPPTGHPYPERVPQRRHSRFAQGPWTPLDSSENIRGGGSLRILHTKHLSENVFPTNANCTHQI
jgi:hypothetical protein